MKASIIIRAFNAAATIGRAIDSALAQEFPKNHYEIIVVDDGSIDGTPEIVQGYLSNPIITYYPQRNEGAVAAANRGFDIAKGEYISLLDGDDEYEPHFLSEMSEALSKSEADFAYADYIEEFDGEEKSIEVDDLFKTIVDNSMYRKASLMAAEYWNPDIFFAEYDLLLRTLPFWKHIHIPRPLTIYHRRKDSLTGDSERVKKGLQQLASKHPDKIAEIQRIRSYSLQS